MRAVDNCENCGRTIGKLEQPYVWRKHVVCAECHGHLSAAPPAAAAAAARPAQAPPHLPAREHTHARVAPPKRPAPPPAPVALQPDAPPKQTAPMLLCSACGHAYPFADVVSDHGKVVCRTCALAAAAEKARTAAREKRTSLVVRGAVAAVALLAVGGGALGTYYIVKSRPDRALANVTNAPPRDPDAAAEQMMARPSSSAPHGEASATAGATAADQAADSASPLFRETAAIDPATPPAAATVAEAKPASPPASVPQPAPQPVPQAAAPAPAPAPAAATVTATTPESDGMVTPFSRPAATNASAGSSPASAAAPAAAAAAAKPAAAPAPAPEGTAAWFVHKGKQLLTQGKYPAALEQFNAAIKKDRNAADAWHGSALCFQNMGDRDSALSRLEKAVTLYSPPNRSAVYNCAVANLRENPMRAAKMIKEYLSRDGAELDEQMHTLMGKALFAVNRQGRLNPVWQEAEEFYFAFNEQLNSARTDGRKRWGGEWVPGHDATEKWNRYRSRQQNVESLRLAVDRATKAKKDAWDTLYDPRTGMRLISDREQRMANERYEHAAKQEVAVRQQQKAAETEFNSTEKPPYPQLVRFVTMDAGAPAPPTASARTTQNVIAGQ